MSETVPISARKLPRLYIAIVLLVLVAACPWVAWGVIGALDSNSNDPRQWLPRGFDETKTYDWLQRHFGNDEITVVSWPGCTLADKRTEQLADALLSDPETSFFETAISGRQTLRKLVKKPLKVPLAEGIERLKGVLVGPDGRTTCVVLTVSELGAANRAGALEQVRRVAKEVCGLDPDELRFGGPTVDAATIDVESQSLLLELASLSGLVALLLMWVRLRSIRLAAIVLCVAVYSTGLALSILYYSGGNMNLVMTMLPPLVFVLSISAAVHLVNYYQDALEEGPAEGAAFHALMHGWRPCALASGTTAMGLLSLGVSEIVPVKMFGIYSAAGMVASLVAVLAVLPVALTVWPGRPGSAGAVQRKQSSSARIDRLVDRICRRHTAILVASSVLMVSAGIGLFSLRSTVKLQYRFGANSRILQDYRWLEENLGPLVPLELVVHFDADNPLSFMEQVQRVGELQQQLRQLPDVGAALSGADFTPSIPDGKSTRQVVQRVYWRRNATAIEQKLSESGLCADRRR